jgi:TatD DNase family protein
MMLVDVHTHLDHPYLAKDIDAVIERANSANVKAMITNGITPDTNRKSLELAKKYKNVYCALGIYPIDALSREISSQEYPIPKENVNVDSEIEFIKKQIKTNDKVLAIGEVGLDYASENANKKKQKEVFQKFIELSEKTKKPIIIHSRKAEADVVDMLESSSVKLAIMHCFSGKFKIVKRIQDNNWFFSIPTNIVRSQQFQKIVDETRLSQIFTETDAPYLSPYKDKMNEPSFITESIKKIAEIKNMTDEEISNQIFMNYQRVFL